MSREVQARFCERLGVRFPGATRLAILRSVIATAQKQGRDVLKTLMGSPDSFIHDIRYA